MQRKAVPDEPATEDSSALRMVRHPLVWAALTLLCGLGLAGLSILAVRDQQRAEAAQAF